MTPERSETEYCGLSGTRERDAYMGEGAHLEHRS